jgi:hypothetical protein
VSRQLYGQAPDLRTLDERISRLERQVRSLMLTVAALTARTAASAGLLECAEPAAREPCRPAEETPVEAADVPARPKAV